MGRMDQSVAALPPFDDEADEDRTPSPDLPLTMEASVHLADLPQSTSEALTADVARLTAAQPPKVVVRFVAVGAAPALAKPTAALSPDHKFEFVVQYLRKRLRCKETDSAFLYVNQAFAPSLDEVVGNLHQVSYFVARTPVAAWLTGGFSASRMGRGIWWLRIR
jgi:ubiquitin-like protein ATG12